MSIKKDTLSGVKWSAIEKFSVEGIHFLVNILLARLLMPSDFGTVAMLSVFWSISRSFIHSGFQSALIRRKNPTDADFCTVFYFNMVISITCYIILFIIAPWVAAFFNTPVLCLILRIQSIDLVINAFGAVQVTQLTIAINFRGLAKRAMAASVGAGIVGVVMAFMGCGLWSLVVSNMVSSVLNMSMVWFYSKWRPKWMFSWKSFHEMFSYGNKLLISGLIGTIYGNLTPLIIGRYFSAGDLGLYARGTRFAKFPIVSINGVIQRVTFPILAKIQDDEKRLVKVYRKYICLMSLCVFFCCTLLAAVAKPFVIFLITDKWASCIIYLQIYCFAVMFDHVSTINLNLLKVVGRSDLFLRLEIVKKCIGLAILFSSIPFGVVGICISKVIQSQVFIAINTYYTGKLFHLGYTTQVKDFSGFFFKSLIACAPAYLFTLLQLPHIVSLLFGLLTAPIIYWLMLRHNPYMKEVLEILRSKLPARFR